MPTGSSNENIPQRPFTGGTGSPRVPALPPVAFPALPPVAVPAPPPVPMPAAASTCGVEPVEPQPRTNRLIASIVAVTARPRCSMPRVSGRMGSSANRIVALNEYAWETGSWIAVSLNDTLSELAAQPDYERRGGSGVIEQPARQGRLLQETGRNRRETADQSFVLEQLGARVVGREALGNARVMFVAAGLVAIPAQAGDDLQQRASGRSDHRPSPAGDPPLVEAVAPDAGVFFVEAEVQIQHRVSRLGDRVACQPDDARDVSLVWRLVAREAQVPVDAQHPGLGQSERFVCRGEPTRDLAEQGQHRFDPDRLVALLVGGEPILGHLRRQLVPELHGVAIEASERGIICRAARHRGRDPISVSEDFAGRRRAGP